MFDAYALCVRGEWCSLEYFWKMSPIEFWLLYDSKIGQEIRSEQEKIEPIYEELSKYTKDEVLNALYG